MSLARMVPRPPTPVTEKRWSFRMRPRLGVWGRGWRGTDRSGAQMPQPDAGHRSDAGPYSFLHACVLFGRHNCSTTEGQPLWMHLPQAMHLSASTTRAGCRAAGDKHAAPRDEHGNPARGGAPSSAFMDGGEIEGICRSTFMPQAWHSPKMSTGATVRRGTGSPRCRGCPDARSWRVVVVQ